MSEATYSPTDNAERAYALWLKAAREIRIRAGQIPPSNPDELRQAREGPRKPSELDAARG